MDWLGPAYALGTAVAWAVGVILFKRSGEGMQPFALNLFKNVVGMLLLGGTFVLMTEPVWPPGAGGAFVPLLLSGAVGIGIADSLLFRCLALLGAGRTAIVESLYSPAVVTCAVLMLGERPVPAMLLGAALVLFAVFLVTTGKVIHVLPRRVLVDGILSGTSAMVAMAVAIVAVKPLLEEHSVLWANGVRLTGGIAVMLVVLPLSRALRRDVAAAFRPSPAWRFAIPGAVVGTYIALLFWIAGFKYATASVAAVLNQTSTFFTVLLAAAFLGESLTPRRIVAVLLAFAGSALVALAG